MDFAPYRDDSPEHERALSPPPPHPDSQPSSQFGEYEDNVGTDFEQRRGGFGSVGRGEVRGLDVFATSLPLRLDYEACLAYLLLPPAGGAFLLLFEHKSDYVRCATSSSRSSFHQRPETDDRHRFHAWQASLAFTFLFAVHIILSFSTITSFALLAADLVLIAYLTMRAYKDGRLRDDRASLAGS